MKDQDVISVTIIPDIVDSDGDMKVFGDGWNAVDKEN